jgi:HEAT repeat protein
MRLRILIGIAVVLTPLVIWRILSSGEAGPALSSGEIAIREDRINGNVEALVEKVKTSPSKLARRATHALGSVGAKSLPALKIILLEDKRPEIREQAAQALAESVHAAVPNAKPITRQMTAALVSAIENDKTPEVRASAVSALGRLYDYNNMASLLKAMDDEDRRVRVRAHQAVTRIFGRRYEFNPDAPTDKRQDVIKIIEQHWQGMKDSVGEYHDANRKPEKH